MTSDKMRKSESREPKQTAPLPKVPGNVPITLHVCRHKQRNDCGEELTVKLRGGNEGCPKSGKEGAGGATATALGW